MIYFYSDRTDHGVPELITALGAKRLLKFDGVCFRSKGKPIEFNPEDVILCWGKHVPPLGNVRILNSSLYYHDQVALNTQGKRWIPYLTQCQHYSPLYSPKNYNEAYQQFCVKHSRAVGRMPLKELKGYLSIPVSNGYKFWTLSVVGGQAIRRSQWANSNAIHNGAAPLYKDAPLTDADVKISSEICQLTGLSVGTISLFEASKTVMSYLLLTAPWLDTQKEVDLFAEGIINYVKKGDGDVEAGSGT